MAQILLLGLGGTGSRVVNNVVKELHSHGREINDGEIYCAVLDTNVNDNENIEQSNTGIPVIGTSKAQKIIDYLEQYNNLHMETWCPSSSSFLQESMIDGASEIRMKSRIAFMDCLKSGVLDDLEIMINEVLKAGDSSKIRVMIVSSLSGGTGSGMFIQVALWLRKALKQSQITIRGIFLLPDVFINTIEDIRKNKTTSTRHYCNAYAAIRELNTLTKIQRYNSLKLPGKIVLGDLFDSDNLEFPGKSIYDFAFFVDFKDERGVHLASISDYEQMVAQLVYMQLFAPMANEMYSEEDNAFLAAEQSEEPLYGSCGTSKAIYPVESVKTYCTIRAAQDSISNGWKVIDGEIEELIEEKKQNSEYSRGAEECIDKRTQYISIFDRETSVKPEDAGRDRFFIKIAKDVKNEIKTKGSDGKVFINFRDKVEDFLEVVTTKGIDTIITRYNTVKHLVKNKEQFVKNTHTSEELSKMITADENAFIGGIDAFDKKSDEYADMVVNTVFPYSMGSIRADNAGTIYGLLSKKDENGNYRLVHPVAARYLLYKLVETMERQLRDISLTESRAAALSNRSQKLFDNPKTSNIEDRAEQLLDSRKWYQGKDQSLDAYEAAYAQYVNDRVALCDTYEKECLKEKVYNKLKERINALIKKIEIFFDDLDDVQAKLDDELRKNIDETSGVKDKTVYVFGEQENKEEIYKSLDLDVEGNNAQINKSVIDSIYGILCAEKRPSNPENADYVDMSVSTSFLSETVKAFNDKIENNAENKEKVEIDIYTAMCKQSDAEFAAKGGKDKKSGIEDFDIKTGKVKENTLKQQRHKMAFVKCKEHLLRLASPYLIRDREISANELGTTTMRQKTFWGFHPSVAESCPYLGTELKVNDKTQGKRGYDKNVLYCYCAVYGMAAKYIPKFNELKGGDYFKCYKAIVSEMVKDAESTHGPRAYVRTPHLDKTWHTILPYITYEKQQQDEISFFRGLWLAIAYGILKVDKDGNLYIRRSVDVGFGKLSYENIILKYKNKNLKKTDVAKLIEVLETDKMFTDEEIPALEQRFANELENMINYVDTEFYKGLTAKRDDLHPIDLIARYNKGRGRDIKSAGRLILALEVLVGELAEHYDIERSEEKIEKATFEICKKIYDSSSRVEGKSESFERWENKFKELGIKGSSSTGKKTEA